MKRKVSIIAMSALLILGMTNILGAAEYPSRPIMLINDSAPGGSNDIIGRIYAAIAEKYLGQPLVLTNRTGGGGAQGLLDVRNARPDGYTLGFTGTGRVYGDVWNEVNGKPVPAYLREFAPIGGCTLNPLVFTVHHDSPWKSLKDVIEAAKTKPDEIIFCSNSYGNTHYPFLRLMDLTGIKLRGVFYWGGGPCHTALIGGHAQIVAQFPSTVIPFVEGKKEKPLAIAGEKRWPALPDVPTCRELGYDIVSIQVNGAYAPINTPADILKKLRDTHQKVLKDQKFKEMVENVGAFVEPMDDKAYMEHLISTAKSVKPIFEKIAQDQKKEK